VVPYHGGKGRLADWIVGVMPAHRVYLEPFAGSAAVLLAKPRCTHEVLNDVDGHVVNFYRVLRDHPEELERACRLTPYARAEYAAASLTEHDLDDEGSDDGLKEGLGEVERARRWWVRVSQSFAHTGSQATGWSTSIMRGSNNAATVTNRLDRMHAVARRLATVTIENRHALDLIGDTGSPDSVVYADPPYLSSTRSAMTRRPGGDYRHEFATTADHQALAKVLHETPATVLLSGYHSPLYEELYAGWDRIERRVLRRTSNGRATTAHQVHVTEVLWSNRPISAQGVLL
jgi:DNA adenine methylase